MMTKQNKQTPEGDIGRSMKKRKTKVDREIRIIERDTILYYSTHSYLVGKDFESMFPKDDLNWFYKFPNDAMTRADSTGRMKRTDIPDTEHIERTCTFEYQVIKDIPNILYEPVSRRLFDIKNLKTLRKHAECKEILAEIQGLIQEGYNGWIMGEDIMIFKPSKWLHRYGHVEPYEDIKLNISGLTGYLMTSQSIYISNDNKCKTDGIVTDHSSISNGMIRYDANNILVGPLLFIPGVPTLKRLMAEFGVKSDNDDKLARKCFERYGTIGLYMCFREEPSIITGCDFVTELGLIKSDVI